MSKQDGKVYIVTYEIQGNKFVVPYIYKTVKGVVDFAIRFKEDEWYAENIKVLVISKLDKSDDGEYYIIKQPNDCHQLVKINDSSKVLFEEF